MQRALTPSSNAGKRRGFTHFLRNGAFEQVERARNIRVDKLLARVRDDHWFV